MLLNSPRGGTEILTENLYKYVDKNMFENINLIISACHDELLSDTKPNILWQHVNIDQGVVQNLYGNSFKHRIDKFVFVSEWQKNKFINEFGLDSNKCMVLNNAIEPIEFKTKPTTGKLQLIYTSTPWRGLHVLLEAFKLLKRNDIELNVYSSTVIYGVNFMKNQFDWLFNLCRSTPGVKYHGYATNKAVKVALTRAHIFSYPSIFEETSCLAAIEAGAAGCKIVTTDWGALSETCGDWASYTSFDGNQRKLVETYAELLNNEIDNYWINNQSETQSKHFNEKFSWVTRGQQWKKLIEEFTN